MICILNTININSLDFWYRLSAYPYFPSDSAISISISTISDHIDSTLLHPSDASADTTPNWGRRWHDLLQYVAGLFNIIFSIFRSDKTGQTNANFGACHSSDWTTRLGEWAAADAADTFTQWSTPSRLLWANATGDPNAQSPPRRASRRCAPEEGKSARDRNRGTLHVQTWRRLGLGGVLYVEWSKLSDWDFCFGPRIESTEDDRMWQQPQQLLCRLPHAPKATSNS